MYAIERELERIRIVSRQGIHPYIADGVRAELESYGIQAYISASFDSDLDTIVLRYVWRGTKHSSPYEYQVTVYAGNDTPPHTLRVPLARSHHVAKALESIMGYVQLSNGTGWGWTRLGQFRDAMVVLGSKMGIRRRRLI